MLEKEQNFDKENMEVLLEKVNKRDKEAEEILNKSIKYNRQPLASEIDKISKLYK